MTPRQSLSVALSGGSSMSKAHPHNFFINTNEPQPKQHLPVALCRWQFNEQGACTRIPQIDDPKAHQTACNSPRSCAAAYPTKVRYKRKGALHSQRCVTNGKVCYKCKGALQTQISTPPHAHLTLHTSRCVPSVLHKELLTSTTSSCASYVHAVAVAQVHMPC